MNNGSIYSEPFLPTPGQPVQSWPRTWKFESGVYCNWRSWFVHFSVGFTWRDCVGFHVGLGPLQVDIGWYLGEWYDG